MDAKKTAKAGIEEPTFDVPKATKQIQKLINEAVIKELEFIIWHEGEPADGVGWERGDYVIDTSKVEARLKELRKQ